MTKRSSFPNSACTCFSEAHTLLRLSSPVLPPPPRAQTLFGNALVRETLFRSGRGGQTGRRVETECFVRHVQVKNEEEIALEPTGPAACIALVPDTRGNRVGKPGLALSGCVTAKTSAFPNRVWARGGNWPAYAKHKPALWAARTRLAETRLQQLLAP